MKPARFDYDSQCLIQAVPKFRGKRILVVGDVMLDRFVWGAVSRISPEAPVPVVEIKTETVCLGGSANVAVNIKALGGYPLIFGVIGDDFEGKRVLAEFGKLGVPIRGLIQDKQRSTSTKTRIIAHNQQVCRTDRETRTPISASLEEKIINVFLKYLDSADGVVISDYAKGFLTPRLLKKILPAAKAARKIVCVDPKLRDFSIYSPATVITPNKSEAEHASGLIITDLHNLLRAGRKILGQIKTDNLLITRGEAGMALFEGVSQVTHIPTVAREVFDVTGAGDTVISTLALGLASGLPVRQSAILANFAAGIVVGKIGTASATPEELISRIESMQPCAKS